MFKRGIYVASATLLAAFGPSRISAALAAPSAKAKCYPVANQDLEKDAANFAFSCEEGKKSFRAFCDLSKISPENAQRWAGVRSAKWTKKKRKNGLKSPFGFVVCKRK